LSERPADARLEALLVAFLVLVGRALRVLAARVEAARFGFALAFVVAFAVGRLREPPVDFDPPDFVAICAS